MTTFAAPSGNGSVAPTTPGVLYSRDNQGTGAVAAAELAVIEAYMVNQYRK